MGNQFGAGGGGEKKEKADSVSVPWRLTKGGPARSVPQTPLTLQTRPEPRGGLLTV